MAQDFSEKLGGETGGSILDLLKQTQQAGQAGVSSGMARQDAQTSKFLDMSQNVFKMRYDTEQPFITDKEGNARDLTQRELLGSMMGVPPEGLTWKRRTEGAGIEQPKMVRVTEEMSRIAKEISNVDITVGEYYPSGTITKFMTRPTTTYEGKLAFRAATKKVDVKAAKEKAAGEMDISFSKVKNLTSNMLAQFKGRIEEQKGGGLLRGGVGKLKAGLKIKGFERTAAFSGQRTETAFALNKILTGQNRVIKGMIDRITETLPGEYDTIDIAINKTAQSLRNSYGLIKAMNEVGLTKEALSKFSDKELADPNHVVNTTIMSLTPSQLSKQEQTQLDNMIDSIINVPAAKRVKLREQGKQKIGRFDILEGGN